MPSANSSTHHHPALPSDVDRALLVGRVWREAPHGGPAVVVVRAGEVIDVSAHVATVADLLDRDDAANFVASVNGESLGSVETLLDNSQVETPCAPYLLAPCDVQA